MSEAMRRIHESIQAEIDDKSSGQGTLSREIEASARDAASTVADALAAITGSDNLRERAQDHQHLAELRLSRSDWVQTSDKMGAIGEMLGYIAHLAIQSAPYMLTFCVGVLIWRAIARRPLDLLDKAVVGPTVLFFFVLGAFLGSSTGPYGAYDVSGAFAHAIVALVLAVACGILLYLLVANSLRVESKVLGTGVRWAANAALMLPMASVYRAALVPLHEFLIGSAALLVAGMVVAFALGCLFHLAREAVVANTPGGKEQYQAAFEEFSRGEFDTGLWAQCLAKADGNESVAKARYLKARAQELARVKLSEDMGSA